MRCPFCRSPRDRVVDSRLSGEGTAIRRRRMCAACKRRFTTYERIEEMIAPMVVKKDARREPFDRLKIVAGLKRACEKRPVSMQTIDEIANRIESLVAERGVKEISSSFIGQMVMDELHRTDQVAYVRFASVYRSFKDIDEFMRELEELIKLRQENTAEGPRPKDDKSETA